MKKVDLFKVNMPDSVVDALEPVLKSGYIADGEKVREFESLLKNYIENPHIVTTNSGTSALTLSLFMAGVKPGDEVITTPMTCTATNMPIANLNAVPVWCDIDPKTGNIDPQKIEGLISERTKAILYVHWAGDVGEIDEINQIGKEHNIKVIEDAADAFGAEYKGNKVGNTKTDFVCFSFMAVKHITTGDGGFISFASAEDAKNARWLKRYGIKQDTFRDEFGEISPDSDIPTPGYNFYMNNIAATIGVEQMKAIEEIIQKHQENGNYYIKNLRGVSGLEMLDRKPYMKSSFWVFMMLAENRDDLLKYLRSKNIYASKLHLRNDIYSCFDGIQKDTLEGVLEFSKKCISIPSGWWVTEEDREYIIETIKSGW